GQDSARFRIDTRTADVDQTSAEGFRNVNVHSRYVAQPDQRLHVPIIDDDGAREPFDGKLGASMLLSRGDVDMPRYANAADIRLLRQQVIQRATRIQHQQLVEVGTENT